MKTTLDLPDELVREVKIRAVTQGKTVKSLVTELLRQGLGISEPGKPGREQVSSWVKLEENGFPLIHCDAKAPAAKMGVAKLLKLENEALSYEDLKRAGLSR